ncbi:MAG: hypothetical protein GXN93_01890 [Candidatus Diapherotrites archaeon]|nr:hypothetical protein [Candidatus Diapherotrites archaeon]
MTENSSRPTGVTVVAALGFIFGILSILGGLFLMVLGIALISQGWAHVGGALGIWSMIMGAIDIVVAWALWTGKSWGWWLTVVLSAIGVLSIFSGNIVGAVISAIILWYFFKPEVKDYFGVKVDFST